MSHWQKFKQTVNRWMDAALQGTRDYYVCHLPDTGILSSLILKFLCRRISLSQDDLDTLKTHEKDGIVVYASKHKSRFEFLFFHSRYRDEGVLFPEIGFEGNIEDDLFPRKG
ncbi:hypothetical protein ACFL0Q_09715, partial [Thermodesulfobacteriota bacterium]